ncbi:hypothetical protein MTO96_011236 [Rhipicephalus appendiculatus]
MGSRHGEEEKNKRSQTSRGQKGLEQSGAKVAGVTRLRYWVPDPNARSPTFPGRSSYSRSSGRDRSRSRPWCPNIDTAPKPPVEGGTSCVALPAGNEPV